MSTRDAPKTCRKYTHQKTVDTCPCILILPGEGPRPGLAVNVAACPGWGRAMAAAWPSFSQG